MVLSVASCFELESTGVTGGVGSSAFLPGRANMTTHTAAAQTTPASPASRRGAFLLLTGSSTVRLAPYPSSFPSSLLTTSWSNCSTFSISRVETVISLVFPL